MAGRPVMMIQLSMHVKAIYCYTDTYNRFWFHLKPGKSIAWRLMWPSKWMSLTSENYTSLTKPGFTTQVSILDLSERFPTCVRYGKSIYDFKQTAHSNFKAFHPVKVLVKHLILICETVTGWSNFPLHHQNGEIL